MICVKTSQHFIRKASGLTRIDELVDVSGVRDPCGSGLPKESRVPGGVLAKLAEICNCVLPKRRVLIDRLAIMCSLP